MPVDEHILGFSNRWYPAAIETAQTLQIAGHEVRVVTPALFIATKLERSMDAAVVTSSRVMISRTSSPWSMGVRRS